MNLKWVADHFDKLQYIFLAMVGIFAIVRLTSKNEPTKFKAREAHRDDLSKLDKTDWDLANAKMRRREPSAPPLSLPGITLNGEPYEILGVRENAGEAEIMRAYKEKMKQFHPDRIQGQAREQIKFYEEAASKLNRAKELMIANLKSNR